MKNIFSRIRNRISAAINADKQKMEEQYGELVRSKSYKKQVIISFVSVVGTLLVLLLNDLYETDKLAKYGVETYATVYEARYIINKHSIGEYLTKCRFYVNGKEYSAKYAINRPLQYGDTLGVLYYPENPKINRLLVPDSLKRIK